MVPRPRPAFLDDVPGGRPARGTAFCPGGHQAFCPVYGPAGRTGPRKGPCDSLVRLMPPVARIAVALVLIIVWGGCSLTRPASRATERPAGPSRYVLPNGVPVIIEEHRASDVVALQLWVQTGARDETARELGLAHYLEHMLFKGTPTRPAGFVEREVEGVGGRINAGTSWDYTFYHTVLPARQVVPGIQMLVDVGVNAS